MNNYVKFRVITLWCQEIMQIEICHKKTLFKYREDGRTVGFGRVATIIG